MSRIQRARLLLAGWLLCGSTNLAWGQFGVPISAPQPLNTNAATDTGDDYASVVTTDKQGHWVAAWSSNDGLGGSLGIDMTTL